MKKSHFLGDWWFLCDLLCHFWWIFGWDWGTPAILRQYPNIYGHFQGKLGFGQFWKKVGIGSDPPPLLGPKSQLLPKICFGGFPKTYLAYVIKKRDLDRTTIKTWNRPTKSWQCQDLGHGKTDSVTSILYPKCKMLFATKEPESRGPNSISCALAAFSNVHYIHFSGSEKSAVQLLSRL